MPGRCWRVDECVQRVCQPARAPCPSPACIGGRPAGGYGVAAQGERRDRVAAAGLGYFENPECVAVQDGRGPCVCGVRVRLVLGSARRVAPATVPQERVRDLSDRYFVKNKGDGRCLVNAAVACWPDRQGLRLGAISARRCRVWTLQLHPVEVYNRATRVGAGSIFRFFLTAYLAQILCSIFSETAGVSYSRCHRDVSARQGELEIGRDLRSPLPSSYSAAAAVGRRFYLFLRA
jgi:hypothetical protein